MRASIWMDNNVHDSVRHDDVCNALFCTWVTLWGHFISILGDSSTPQKKDLEFFV